MKKPDRSVQHFHIKWYANINVFFFFNYGTPASSCDVDNLIWCHLKCTQNYIQLNHTNTTSVKVIHFRVDFNTRIQIALLKWKKKKSSKLYMSTLNIHVVARLNNINTLECTDIHMDILNARAFPNNALKLNSLHIYAT